MSDVISTIHVEVEVQANGIIRDLDGDIIGRLSEGVSYEELVNKQEDRLIWMRILGLRF